MGREIAGSIFEIRRKFIHIGAGAAILLLMAAGVEGASLSLLLLLALLAGVYFVDRKIKAKRTPLMDELFALVERPRHPPGYGAFWYGVGLLLLFSFLRNAGQIASGVFILAFADGLASIAGKGGHTLPYNNAKSWEGSAIFLATSCLTYLFIGPSAIPLALFATLVESLNLHLDDNFTVPLACVVFFKLWG